MITPRRTEHSPFLDDENASWRSPKILTILLIVFVCGIAFGSAGTRYILHARSSPTFLDLKVKLGLSPDQEETVRKELDDYAKYYQNIEEERGDVAEHGRRRIYLVLTPEQRKRFDDFFPVLPTNGQRN